MRDRGANRRRHLTPDEVEALALGFPGRPRRAEVHLAACSECRREVESLHALDEVMSGLDQLAPSPGFSQQVMARVTLRLPWHARARSLARDRWVALAAASVTLVAATSVLALWLAGQPELSITGLSELVIGQLRDFSLQVVMGIGSLLWSSPFLRWVVGAANQIGMEGAILALSALSLVTISAAGAMVRLLQPAPLRLRNAA